MSAEIYNLAKAICDTLALNEQLSAYCVANFGQAPKIYLGIDTNNPPADGALPWVAIVPDGSGIADTWDHREHRLTIVCASTKNAISTDSATGVITIDGFSTAFELAERVWEAIQPIVVSDETQHTYALMNVSEATVQASFPYFHSARTITVADAIQ